MAGLDWPGFCRKDVEAGRDPNAVFRMPLCRFVAVYLPIDKATLLELLNEDRKRRGQEPFTGLP